MTPDDIRQQLELAIVELLKAQMAAGTMSEDRAQAISQMVLDTLKPGMTFDELYKAIPHLDDTYSELSPIILPILRDYEQNVNQKALDGVRELIRQGQFDAAVKLGKQAATSDLHLVWTGSAKPEPKP